jgi:proteasome lid subunit RPN8/RPN11
MAGQVLMLRDGTRIRISDSGEIKPGQGHIPSTRAIRWLSPFEEPQDAPGLSVFMTPSAYIRCCAHAGSDLEHEVGGALVGRWKVDLQTEAPYVVIEGILPARHTRQGPAFVTFTQDSLVGLNDELEERYPGRLMVGWYHTHPRMSVFLSGYDLWIHDHFFSDPWQVALVIEPASRAAGFFVRRGNRRLDPRSYAGFFELLRDGRGSLMVWTNLRQAQVTTAEGGS